MSAKKTVPQRIPRRYKEDMRGLQERYDLHEGLVINVSLKEFRGICERDYPKIEAYLGLKKFLLRTFGVTLNIHSQKTKGGSDKKYSNNTKTIDTQMDTIVIKKSELIEQIKRGF